MKKILVSLSIIAAVAAIAVGATRSVFSDEEKTVGNTFTAGTIDIELNGNNGTTVPYNIADVKPGETGYINFNIKNVGQNPVNVSKHLGNWDETTGLTQYSCTNVGGVSSEPECVAAQTNSNNDLNNIKSQIVYDLSVKVYASDGATEPIWYQAIYTGATGETLDSIYPTSDTFVNLGMIPVGGHMKVTQSYHLSYDAGNIYQGDKLSFDITFQGQQLTGADGYASVVLENKTGAPAWDIVQGDGISGTLKYKTQGPVFDFSFSGKAPLVNHNYVLAVGYDTNTNVNKKLADVTSDASGNVALVSGSVNTGNLTNAKAWLVPAEDWTDPTGMTAWNNFPGGFLWETALIDYTQN